MSPGEPKKTVAILAMAEAGASVIYGMYDLFRSAGRDWQLIVDGKPGEGVLHTLVVSADGRPVSVINGIQVVPDAAFGDIPVPDIVCVPEVAVPPDAPLTGRFETEVAWLRHCHAHGAILASACSGALLFAETGLLDGHEATTHWAFCDALGERFPNIRMRPQSALVASGEGQRIIMAGGGTSWADLALYLIARTAGVEAAMQVARINVMDWHTVGQQPYAQLARTRQVEDAEIARCQVWLGEHYNEPAPVAAMVRLSGMAERTFKRRFQQATGLSPLEYVQTLRLEEAKHLLETGDDPVEAVANAVGYEDAGFFGRLFKRKVNLTPVQYRRRFGSMRRMLEAGP